jgi:transcriptional regulator with XRE-family HTH domain
MPWNEPNWWMSDPQAKRGMVLIGAALRRQRLNRGWSQRDLEGLTGVHQSTISRLETGQRCGVRWTRFAKMVAILGGLDFGRSGGVGSFGPFGLSPNPTVALKQVEQAEAMLRSARSMVESRIAGRS